MKIKEIKTILECEHCGHTEEVTDDNSIHSRAIEYFYCEKCGKNRKGELQDK